MISLRLSAPLLAIAALAGVLAGCAGTDSYVPKAEPSMYRSLAQPGAQLDDAAAASMISGYRANSGLPAVTLDPELTRLAQGQAEVMAKRDRLDHAAGKPFLGRLRASGYDAKTAAENIG
ncbi:MAG: CAP domain-containing protein, partial [Pseudolabrys sp.]|nr:CAP domain-containing protein [Pseudolabrys sp.]